MKNDMDVQSRRVNIGNYIWIMTGHFFKLNKCFWVDARQWISIQFCQSSNVKKCEFTNCSTKGIMNLWNGTLRCKRVLVIESISALSVEYIKSYGNRKLLRKSNIIHLSIFKLSTFWKTLNCTLKLWKLNWVRCLSGRLLIFLKV